MSRAGILLLAFLIAGFAALVLLPGRAPAPDVPFTASEIHLQTYTESGDLSWEVHASEGTVEGDEGALHDVEVRFVSTDSDALVATADRLVRGAQESVLSGNVEVSRGDGLHLSTDELTWEEGNERFRTSAVEFSLRDAVLSGSALEYDLQEDRARMEGGIVSTIEEEGITLQADRAEEINRESVHLAGGVEAEFPEGRLRADRAEMAERGLALSGNVSLRLDLEAVTTTYEEVPDGP
jgi:hypothetical protein